MDWKFTIWLSAWLLIAMAQAQMDQDGGPGPRYRPINARFLPLLPETIENGATAEAQSPRDENAQVPNHMDDRRQQPHRRTLSSSAILLGGGGGGMSSSSSDAEFNRGKSEISQGVPRRTRSADLSSSDPDPGVHQVPKSDNSRPVIGNQAQNGAETSQKSTAESTVTGISEDEVAVNYSQSVDEGLFEFSDDELMPSSHQPTPLKPLDSDDGSESDPRAPVNQTRASHLDFWRKRCGKNTAQDAPALPESFSEKTEVTTRYKFRPEQRAGNHGITAATPPRQEFPNHGRTTQTTTSFFGSLLKPENGPVEAPASLQKFRGKPTSNDVPRSPPKSPPKSPRTSPQALIPPKTHNIRFTKYLNAGDIFEGSVHTVEFCQQWPWISGLKASMQGYRRPKHGMLVHLNLWHLRAARNTENYVQSIYPDTVSEIPIANIPSTMQPVQIRALYTFDTNYFWGPNVAVHTVREDPDVTIDRLLETPELNPQKSQRTWAQLPVVKPIKMLVSKTPRLYAPLPRNDMYIRRHVSLDGRTQQYWRCFNAMIDLPTHMSSGEYLLSVDGLPSPERDQLISAWGPSAFHVVGTAPEGYNENPEQLGVNMKESPTTSMMIVPSQEFIARVDPYMMLYKPMKPLPLKQVRLMKSASTGSLIQPKVTRVAISPAADIIQWKNGHEEQIYFAIEIENPPEELFFLAMEVYFGEPTADFYQPLFRARVPFEMGNSGRSVLEISQQIRCSDLALLEVIRSQESEHMMVRLRFRWQVGAQFPDLMQLFLVTKIRRGQRLPLMDAGSFSLPIRFSPSELSQISQSIRAFEFNWFKRIHENIPLVEDVTQPDNMISDLNPNMSVRIELPSASRQFPDNWITEHFPCPLSSWEFRIRLHEYPMTQTSTTRELLNRKSLWEGRSRFYILHPHDILATSLDLRSVFRKAVSQTGMVYFFTLHRISDRFTKQSGMDFISKPFRVTTTIF